MADVRISELLEVTSPTTTDVLPIVHSGTTRKVTVENLGNANPITTFVQQTSAVWNPQSSVFVAFWNAGLRNMPSNTLSIINFNQALVNTDSNNYTLETGNNDVAVDGKIRINKTGIYYVNVLYNSFNISDINSYSLHLFTNTGSKTDQMSHYSTVWDTNANSYGADQRVLMTGSGVVHVNTAPVWIAAVFRPTGTYPVGNGPFPSSTVSGGGGGLFSQHPKIEIIRAY